MFNELSDDLLLLILSYTDYNFSLLIGLTCKSFLKHIKKNLNNKRLQFKIPDPERQCYGNEINLLIYSHKYQIKKKRKKNKNNYIPRPKEYYQLRYFNLWDNYLMIKLALNNNFRECFAYALDNNLLQNNYIDELYISAAFKLGTMDDVNYLNQKIDFSNCSNICVSKACEHNKLNILYYLYENIINIESHSWAYIPAIVYGHLECLKFFVEKHTFNFKEKKQAIITAVENHKIDCLDYILENIEEPKILNNRSKYNKNTAETAAYLAARIDSLDSLKAIYDNNYKFSKDKCKHICVKEESHECLEYIYLIENEEYIDKLRIIIENHENFGWWKPITCLKCAEYGYLEGIKYAVQNYLYFDYDRCLETAESFDNKDCVNYLLDLG